MIAAMLSTTVAAGCGSEPAPVCASLASVQPQETLVLWLRPADLQRLGALAPAGSQAYGSATLAQRDVVPLPAPYEPGPCLCLDDEDCGADHGND